jgi:hypothetical protein
LRSLWFSSQSGNYPENNLAKSGCEILDMKVDQNENKNLSMFLANLVELIIKIWWIWAIFFFREKSFVYVEIMFFQVEIWQKFASKRNSGWGHAGFLLKILWCMY